CSAKPSGERTGDAKRSAKAFALPTYLYPRRSFVDRRAGAVSAGFTRCGTFSVRLYFASDAASGVAFAIAAFRSAIAFGAVAFASAYAVVVCSPGVLPAIKPFFA